MDPPLEITTTVPSPELINGHEVLTETTTFEFRDEDDINKLSAFLYFDQCHEYK